MKCIENLRAKLESIGASLDEGAGFTLNCDAPPGYVWRATDCLSVPIAIRNTSGQSWAAKAIQEEEADRLAGGLRKVTDPEELAAKRHDVGEDDWGAPADAPEFIAWPTGEVRQ